MLLARSNVNITTNTGRLYTWPQPVLAGGPRTGAGLELELPLVWRVWAEARLRRE